MQMNPFLFFKKLIKLQLSLFMLTISLFSQIPSSESIISTLSSRKLIQSAISAPLNASSDSTSIVQLPLVLSTFHNLRIPTAASTPLAWKTVIRLKHPSPIQHSYTSEQTTKNPPIPNFIEKLLAQLVFFRCTHDPISHWQFPNYPNIFLIHPLFTCTLQSMYYATSKALSIMVFAILHLRQNLPSNVHPLGFSDSSHAADPDDRKSHSGYIYFMFNGAIIWSSSKQSIVTLSSMEAEYIELTDAAKEAIFLRKLLASLNMDINDPTMVLTDSESALDHVKNNVKHAHTKHIDTRFHYIRSI